MDTPCAFPAATRCHASGIRHAGHAISRGVRWVLVVFLLSADEPQLVRRCANLARDAAGAALAAEDDEDDEEGERRREGAHAALATALALAPSDFQLHHDRGLLLMDGGDALQGPLVPFLYPLF